MGDVRVGTTFNDYRRACCRLSQFVEYLLKVLTE